VERRLDFGRYGDRLQASRIVGARRRPDAHLVAFDRALSAVQYCVADLEGLVVPLGDLALHDDLVAEFRRRQEIRFRLYDRQSQDAVALAERIPVEPDRIPEEPRALVEPDEVVRVEDDLRGIGVAPMDDDVVTEGLHGWAPAYIRM